jgi:hypothetical protein
VRCVICGGCIRSAKSDVYRLCVALNKTREPDFETFPKAMHFGKSWVKFEFRRNKKGKVFGILSQLKNMCKSKDVHAQNETFLSST